MPDQTQQPSDAVWTVPNVLTFVRLGLTPLFLYLALGPRNMGAAFAVAFIATLTDLADGRIARRYGSITRLGIALDPLADRLGLAAGAVVLLIHDLAPLWALLGVLGRDVLLLVVGVPILRARKIAIPPVSRLGKAASFGISVTFGLYLIAAIPGIEDPWLGVRTAGTISAIFWLPLYYASGAGYVRAGLSGLSGRPPG